MPNQLDAVKVIYEGPKDKHGQLYYGFPFGGETDFQGWSRWFTGGLKYRDEYQAAAPLLPREFPDPILPTAHFGFGTHVMKYFIYHNPDWNYATYRFDTFREDAKSAAAVLNATDADLNRFHQRGGKLLMYSGWSDNAITPLGTIGYFEAVLEHNPDAENSTRLFMMPGVLHCMGGKGPSHVNFLNAIDHWVTTGKAPDQLTTHFTSNRIQPTDETRRLCAYPRRAIYDNAGNPRAAESFSCSTADWSTAY
jgi:feruloyl esterase